jgi:hypothetical protein
MGRGYQRHLYAHGEHQRVVLPCALFVDELNGQVGDAAEEIVKRAVDDALNFFLWLGVCHGDSHRMMLA